MDNFLKNQQYFPDDLDIKKKYFEENNWQTLKKDLGKAYVNLRTTP